MLSRLKPDFVGDGGAYISEICERFVGEVKAEKSWRMLSH